jgi:hypothetical protein
VERVRAKAEVDAMLAAEQARQHEAVAAALATERARSAAPPSTAQKLQAALESKRAPAPSPPGASADTWASSMLFASAGAPPSAASPSAAAGTTVSPSATLVPVDASVAEFIDIVRRVGLVRDDDGYVVGLVRHGLAVGGGVGGFGWHAVHMRTSGVYPIGFR